MAVKQLTRLEELQAQQSEWEATGAEAHRQQSHNAQKYLGKRFRSYIAHHQLRFSTIWQKLKTSFRYRMHNPITWP